MAEIIPQHLVIDGIGNLTFIEKTIYSKQDNKGRLSQPFFWFKCMDGKSKGKDIPLVWSQIKSLIEKQNNG